MDAHYRKALACNAANLGRGVLDLSDHVGLAQTVPYLAARLESDVMEVLGSTAKLVALVEESVEGVDDSVEVSAALDEIGQGVAVAIGSGYRLAAAIGRPDVESEIDLALSSELEPAW